MLRWTPSPSAGVVGYVAYVGDRPGFFGSGAYVPVDIGNKFTMVNGIAHYPIRAIADADAFIVMTAYDQNGLESIPSNELFVAIDDPLPPAQCSVNADCSDGNQCNGLERCSSGTCVAGTPMECASPGPCQVGQCDPILGCLVTNLPNGTQCSDGDPLTSNDMCSAGTCSGTITPPPADATYSESFESYAAGRDPQGWYDTGSQNALWQNAALFKTVKQADGNTVFGTTSTASNTHSHLIDMDPMDDTEVSGRMWISDTRGGVGVTLFSSYPKADKYYRIRRYDGAPTFRLASHPESGAVPVCTGKTDTGVQPAANRWYRFKFRAGPEGSATHVQAKVWLESSSEPADWQIDCLDSSAGRLTSGVAGVWSMGPGLKAWDDFTVAPLAAAEPEPECRVDLDCADGNLCNGTEQCVAGSCTAGTALSCTSSSTCSDATCDPTRGCIEVDAPTGRSCDDGNACTVADSCSAGTCGGAPTSCPQPTQCQVGLCDSKLGCLLENLADGTVCDDGNATTFDDMCALGQCVGIVLPPPDPEPEPEPEPEPNPTPNPSGPVIFFEDFQTYGANQNPNGWFDTGSQNALWQNDALFKTVTLDGGNVAFGTSSTATNIHSHYVLGDSDAWTQYELSGRMQVGSASGGIGVTMYSKYATQDRYLRLRRYANEPTFKLSSHDGGSCAGVTDTGISPTAGYWYEFRFRAVQADDQVHVQARVWREDEAEPAAWQIDCAIAAAEAPTAGRVGVWSMGTGAKYWDDLMVYDTTWIAPAPVDPTLVHAEDFEAYAAGDEPEGWLDTAANNSMSPEDGLFDVMNVGGSRAFGTTSTGSNIHSHFVGSDPVDGGEVSGRMWMGDANGGIGFTLLSDYPRSDSYYRVRRYDREPTFHLAPHPQTSSGPVCVGSTDTGVQPLANQWYRFKLRAEPEGGATRVQAKVWPESGTEPSSWQIDCLDSSGGRLSTGVAGVWSHGPGLKAWDDFVIRRLED